MSVNQASRSISHEMDGETAMAFAGHRFEQLHPRTTCPDWLARCTAIGYTRAKDRSYIVSFTLTPKGSDRLIVFFKSVVDPSTAETEVLIDLPLGSFESSDLMGY